LIAIPIIEANVNKVIEKIALANKEADYIELRLDYLPQINESELKKLINACEKPVICTCRPVTEGGFFKDAESKRIAVLKKAMQFKADFIDVEFETKKNQFEKISEARKKSDCKIIISKHYFGFTPEYAELEKLLKNMHKLKPDVVKIVTKANSQEDNKIIFSLLKFAKSKGIKLIAFCMGTIGRDSRILCVPLGSFLTFASLDSGDESADGQIPVKEMKKIYAGLRVMF